jgi:hypothetical protein
MAPYTYDLGEFLTVESEVELTLLDIPSRASASEAALVIRRGTGDTPTVEWTGHRAVITVPPSMVVTKDGSVEPVQFTKILLSAIQALLLRQRATLVFGSAFRGPDGNGIGLFGPTNCGKSAASFQLARDWGYRLLADDLLICHEGMVYPFPRYMNLPRDVAAIEQWAQCEGASAERVRSWPDEVDVPRRLVTDSVPERVALDVVLLVTPCEAPAGSPEPISTERAVTMLAEFRHSALAGWISEPRAREAIDDGGVDWRPIACEAIAEADCYRLEAPQADLARSVAELVEG